MALNSYKFLLGLAMSSIFVANLTHAEIILHGTRVIYPSDAREVTLQVSNNGSKPSLVQAWIDDGDPKSTPDQSKVPFMITPPISRVDPTKSQSLRISALPNIIKYIELFYNHRRIKNLPFLMHLSCKCYVQV